MADFISGKSGTLEETGWQAARQERIGLAITDLFIDI